MPPPSAVASRAFRTRLTTIRSIASRVEAARTGAPRRGRARPSGPTPSAPPTSSTAARGRRRSGRASVSAEGWRPEKASSFRARSVARRAAASIWPTSAAASAPVEPEQLRVAEDHGHQVVDVVGDPAGEPSDGVERLGAAVPARPSSRSTRDVPRDRDDRPRRRPSRREAGRSRPRARSDARPSSGATRSRRTARRGDARNWLRSRSLSSGTLLPTSSSAVQPKIASAPGFHIRTVPSSSATTIASGDASTTAWSSSDAARAPPSARSVDRIAFRVRT